MKTRGEDGHLQAKESGLEQILASVGFWGVEGWKEGFMVWGWGKEEFGARDYRIQGWAGQGSGGHEKASNPPPSGSLGRF